jgi:NADH-ubiquinone oxidoreductase chain 4
MFFFDTSWPCLVTYYGVLESLKIRLIVLTIIIIYLMIFEKTQSRWLIQKIFLLGIMLVLCFSVCDIFIFFVFFELSLLPTVYIIFSWGVQPERLLARSYFLIYAILGSFPLLCKIIKFIKVNGSYIFILPYCSKTRYLKTFFSNNYLTVF